VKYFSNLLIDEVQLVMCDAVWWHQVDCVSERAYENVSFQEALSQYCSDRIEVIIATAGSDIECGDGSAKALVSNRLDTTQVFLKKKAVGMFHFHKTGGV
jgi:hypothetical protein